MAEHLSLAASKPVVVRGGRSVDDRGSLGYINGFPLNDFKRFYTVQNHQQGFIRAWHGHLIERKAITVLRGTALICAVRMTDKTRPSQQEEVHRFVLSESPTDALVIPAGYANGFMTLTANALLLIFSTTSLEESLNDDFRFPFDYWNPWTITPR
jgi:dTDP-4-dehydrorhamnose 3,5-epimerase